MAEVRVKRGIDVDHARAAFLGLDDHWNATGGSPPCSIP
jgi:hypothetical protein